MSKSFENLNYILDWKNPPSPARLIEIYRLRANLTRKQLTDLLELKSDRMVRIWETGAGLPSPERLRQLLKIYQLNQVFNPGREIEEASRLWDTVKKKFETGPDKKEIYPAFDEGWFTRLQIAPVRSQTSNHYPVSQTVTAKKVLPQQHNLPTFLTNFVGREPELKQIGKLLGEHRLITLTGPGGIGKTRLAIEAASSQLSLFPDGVWLVELASLRSPEFLVTALAHVLKLSETSGKELNEGLVDFLHAHRVLLILDNCEHLVEECARLVNHLLSYCYGLKILTTSREPLSISGEWVLRVPSLTLPEPAQPLEIATLMEYEGISLFLERVKAVEPGFTLNPQNTKSITEICTRLDGIPLALELAAVQVRGIGITQLASRLRSSLEEPFSQAIPANRSALPRHQTLLALTQWSYNLLEERVRVLFRRLVLFSNDWSVEAAEAVCGGEFQTSSGSNFLAPEEILGLLAQLVNKSLLQVTQPEGRYSFLETIRLFALQKLNEIGEAAITSQRHFAYYLALALEGQSRFDQPDQAEWLEKLDREQANFRAALEWATNEGRGEEAARLALALWKFWQYRAYLREGQAWLEKVLALSPLPLPGDIHPRLYNALGVLSQLLNQFDKATTYQEMALNLWREKEDKAGMAQGLLDLGFQSFNQVELERAQRYATESLELARETGKKQLIASALNLWGMAAVEAGKLEGVRPILDESLAIWRELGEMATIATTLVSLIRLEQRLGNLEAAKSMFPEAIHLQIKFGNYVGLIGPLVMLLHLSLVAKKQPEGAKHVARVLGAMTAWNETIQADKSRWSAQNDAGHIKIAVRILGQDLFEQEFRAGKALMVEEILLLADEIVQLEGSPQPVIAEDAAREPDQPSRSKSLPSTLLQSLTGRETEVLRLVASGFSNQKIAEKLVISPRTVEAHLRAIYSKLEVTSRIAATRFALEYDLA